VCPQPVAQVVVAISEETRDRVKASATSLRDVVAGVVTAFTPAPVQEVLRGASAALTVPAGWFVATPGDTVEQPVRAVVTGHRSRGGAALDSAKTSPNSPTPSTPHSGLASPPVTEQTLGMMAKMLAG
jgi:hypothetical protein